MYNSPTAQVLLNIENYIFLNNQVLFAKNYNSFDNAGASIGKIFQFENSKLKKAIVDLYNDYSTRLIPKYFTYSQNERPQFCYLNHQKATSTFDFDDDMADGYDKLVYLG